MKSHFGLVSFKTVAQEPVCCQGTTKDENDSLPLGREGGKKLGGRASWRAAILATY
jgi:hypothetical protein